MGRMKQAPATLLEIAALARAGATEIAWDRLSALPAASSGDAAALTVRGRLLKDRASGAGGDRKLQLLRDAARAYGEAAKVSGSTYPMINAATLLRLSGDCEAARQGAQETLLTLAKSPDEPETPYWRAATRAEALLLLDREAEAGAALVEAVALAPRAWEDHAATLRQFALILAEQGREAGWLDPLRPPRSLHFGGHMAFSGERGPTGLLREIEDALEQERVGFGYGALAAGADIIVAEALLARGA